MSRHAIIFVYVLVTITNNIELLTAGESVENTIRKSTLLVLTYSQEGFPSLHKYSKCAAANTINTLQWTGTEPMPKLDLVTSKLKETLVNNKDPIVLYTSSYNRLFLGTETEIIAQFKSGNYGILFSAGRKCRSDKYVNCTVERLPDPGAFIGRASALLQLFESMISKDESGADHDFLDTLRDTLKFSLEVDTGHEIFQNVLHGAGIGSCSARSSYAGYNSIEVEPAVSWGELELEHTTEFPVLLNTRSRTRPLVLFGDTSPVSSSLLNNFGDYLCGGWLGKYECSDCLTVAQRLRTTQELPTVVLGIFLARPMPFLHRFFANILNLDYPKEMLHLVFYNGNGRNEAAAETFLAAHNISYASVYVIDSYLMPWEARNIALQRAIDQKQAYYFSIDGEARLDRPSVLRDLIEQNRTVVSPLLVQPYGTSSNYWGALNEKGRPIRALNYKSVVSWAHRGLWRVPCLNKAYLLNITGLRARPDLSIAYSKNNWEILCAGQNHSRAWPFYVSNIYNFGHTVTPSLKRYPHDIYQVTRNRYDWEQTYLHPDWSSALDSARPVAEPCRDAFWFPLVRPRFCAELIRLMEEHGGWSVGTNYKGASPWTDEHPNPDPYPTVDIDLVELDLDGIWLDVVRNYVLPVRRRVFSGDVVDPPFIHTTIVIRYKPEEQSANEPHHDSSTYTLNLALNEHGLEYEGGGCRFLSSNCSVVRTRVGWILMHPGELTHYHEGMSVTRGTRYIMVSFLDPRIKDLESI